MTTSMSEEEAIDAWLEDLEAEDASCEAAASRLAEPSSGDPRETAYRLAAARWLERGQGRVALALLERAEAGSISMAVGVPGRTKGPSVDSVLPGILDARGLPALTEDEADALRQAEEPEEALAIIRGARRRLEAHGEEARRLLRRWVDRPRRGRG